MVKVNFKKGSKLACIPCGREVIIDCCGAATRTIWCCEKPMRKAAHAKSKKMSKK